MDADFARGILNALASLRAPFSALETLSWSEMAQLAEQVRDAVEVVWKVEGRHIKASLSSASLHNIIQQSQTKLGQVSRRAHATRPRFPWERHGT